MMTEFTPIASAVGGLLIGLASVVMLFFNGRIAGISGIVGGLLGTQPGDRAWRAAFLAGLFAGGLATAWVWPSAFGGGSPASTIALVAAGLLVGVGTRLGSGCTSGHGVCGMSRLSARSVVATMTFMTFGAAAVFAARHFGG